jgi:hypothetical protein
MDVDREVVDESLLGFRRTPGSSKEAIEIRPEHRAGVIEREERIKADPLELTLTGNTAAAAGSGVMVSARMMEFEVAWIMRIFIR